MNRTLAVGIGFLLAGPAFAQPSSDWERLAAKKYADCVVIETMVTTVTTPVGGRASAGCDTGGGGVKSCSVTVAPTQADYFLDTTIDVNTPWVCVKLDGDNPCAFVQATPILFSSDTRATRTFTTNSDRVALSQSIPQVKKESTYTFVPQPSKTLYRGTTFAVAIKKTAASARFECTLSNGNQEIYPVLDRRNLSDEITWDSKNENDPVFNIIKYKVTK